MVSQRRAVTASWTLWGAEEPPQEEVLVDGQVIEYGRDAAGLHVRPVGDFAGEDDLKLLGRGGCRAPLDQVACRGRRHSGRELLCGIGRGPADRKFLAAGKEVQAPAFEGLERADVWKRIAERASDGQWDHSAPVGAPLLENAARAQTRFQSGVEFDGVEEARTRGFDRRRGIDGDDIKLLRGPLQEAATVVNDDAGAR